jgi:cell wall-associated NlpC family hydrolase
MPFLPQTQTAISTITDLDTQLQAQSLRAAQLELIRQQHDAQIQVLTKQVQTQPPAGPTHQEIIADKIISAGIVLGKFNIPYAFGGDTFAEGGLDCSGFTRLLYGNIAGVTLPRVSGDQSKVGQPVAKADVRKGDLLFFTYSTRNDGLPTHVGIYAGNGTMLHTNNDKERIHISPVDLDTTTAIRRVF